MVLADTLSRAVLSRQLSTPSHGPTPDNKDIIDVAKIQTSFERQLELVNMIDDVPLPGHQLTRLRAATSTDVVLQELVKVIQVGWQQRKSEVSPCVRTYFDVRDELVVDHGIVFRINRRVIPQSLRWDVLQKIHDSHMGMEGCIRRARESVFWPGMRAAIQDYVSKCETCQRYSRKQQRETLKTN